MFCILVNNNNTTIEKNNYNGSSWEYVVEQTKWFKLTAHI